MDFLTQKGFKILDIPIESDFENAKRKYRKKCLLSHPDKGGDEATFRECYSAWQIVKKYFVFFELNYYNIFVFRIPKILNRICWNQPQKKKLPKKMIKERFKICCY